MVRTKPPTWSEIDGDFEVDGSWRDIYLSDADGWSALFRTVRRWRYPVDFIIDRGVHTDLPETYLPAMRVAQRGPEDSYFIEIDAASMWLRANFFFDEVVELYLDPARVRDDATLAPLYEFMLRFSEEANEPILMSWENVPDWAFLAYLPREKVWLFKDDAADANTRTELLRLGTKARQFYKPRRT